ncbi:hypothetical protein CANTEDRAFT_134993 [Yamadazyma tenuis ATCC 10573]|nr:uncharacterized protein CANTEDRAFT_134993 [Yamadazyma tenuis ATCC 10573]EGV63160.1 hypothetical protein CANTEDRAFT_134993 [Yamadazyma tenuis ATCC 10573]
MVNEYHVINKGIFQLFLIREDQSILGSVYHLSDLTLDLMNHVNVFNCNVSNPKTWNLNNADTELVMDALSQLLKDLEAGVYQNLTVYANNRCRQRQLINKNLLVWDSLQVQSENFEMEIYNNYKIGDKLSDTDENALPISSFIYSTKLELMIEFLLIGIELELYREFEIYSIYWYINYLTKVYINHSTERLLKFNKYKISKIVAKKKKSKNKQELEQKREKLTKINEALQHKIDYWKGFQRLINSVCLLLNYLQNQKMIKFDDLTANFITSFESLFRLRFKPFESIGVPSQLTFAQYSSSFASDVSQDEVINSLNMAKEALVEYNKSVTNDNEKQWISSLVKTCFSYILELKGGKNVFEVSPGYNTYFPKFTAKLPVIE